MHLDLSSNDLTGTIPIEMDELNQLTYLFLAKNDFTQGSIPTFVYTYKNLKELSLKGTQRTGQISQLIGLLDKLVLLDLDYNELTGAIPTEIASLNDLQFLLLNRNQLSQAVPAELSQLDKLRKYIHFV
jgi:Leucine-rich repeat (LRR) protein